MSDDNRTWPWERDIDAYYSLDDAPRAPYASTTLRESMMNEPRGPRAGYALNREKVRPKTERVSGPELSDRLD